MTLISDLSKLTVKKRYNCVTIDDVMIRQFVLYHLITISLPVNSQVQSDPDLPGYSGERVLPGKLGSDCSCLVGRFSDRVGAARQANIAARTDRIRKSVGSCTKLYIRHENITDSLGIMERESKRTLSQALSAANEVAQHLTLETGHDTDRPVKVARLQKFKPGELKETIIHNYII
eukprot:sb/3471928/